MRKALPVLLALLVIFVPGISSCAPSAELNKEQRLDLIQEIKAFEKELGFNDTENFMTYSQETKAYDYYFYTPSTHLPYSLDDPALQSGTGTPKSVSLDSTKYDVYFYSIPALAGIKTPVTKSLLEAPLYRYIRLIFHEDWHEQIDLPLGIEESSAEAVSYTAAMLFTAEKFGEDSNVYRTLRDHLSNKLRESVVYQKYYDELTALYSQFQAGTISEAETIEEKNKLLKSMKKELWNIWGGVPDQLNNAFIAFQMTYLRHLLVMHQVLAANDFNLPEAIAIFRSMPGQGTRFNSLEQLQDIERQVIDYLSNGLKP